MEICKSTRLVIYATLFVSCMIRLFVSVSVILAILVFPWPISCSLTEITQIAKQILPFHNILEKKMDGDVDLDLLSVEDVHMIMG